MRPSAGGSVWIGLVVLGLVLGFGAGAVLAWPRVTDIVPAEGAQAVPATASIRLTFRSDMDQASVAQAFSVSPAAEGTITWEGRRFTYTPDVPWPSDTAVTVRLASGAASALGLPILRDATWSFRTGQPRIAYLFPSDGAADLYLKGLDDAEATRLTETPLGITEAQVGRRGTAIVYLARRADGGSDVRLRDLMTGGDVLIHTCLADLTCRAPALSPDGTMIALAQVALVEGVNGPVPGRSRVWILSTGSGAPFAIGAADHVTSLPAWAPDGLLCYHDATLGAQVVVDPRRGADAPVLAFLPNDLGAQAAWAPDSRGIVFPEIALLPEAQADGETGGESEAASFFSHLIRGEIPSAVLTDLSARNAVLVEDASPAFSPDGAWLAFARKSLQTRRWTPGRQLWIMTAEGDAARALTDSPMMNHSALEWRPDSRALVYMRFDTSAPHQPPEIWWLTLPDGEARLLAVGGYQPRWIP